MTSDRLTAAVLAAATIALGAMLLLAGGFRLPASPLAFLDAFHRAAAAVIR